MDSSPGPIMCQIRVETDAWLEATDEEIQAEADRAFEGAKKDMVAVMIAQRDRFKSAS